jgi:hypothetical protein
MRSGWIKRFGIGALVFVVTGGVVELVADLRSRRLRAERSALGDRLYTEVRGQGDPVVFLAGLPATTRFWQGAFDPLAATNRLIFVDALGFGRCPLPDGTLRNVVLTQPIARPLAGLGPKVTFVHGRAERTTSLARIRAMAEAIGAQVLATPDDHLSYPTRSAGRILAALRAASPDPRPELPTR